VVVRIVSFFLLMVSISLAAERFAVPYRPDIDLTNSPVTFSCNNYKVTVDLSRPLLPFKNINMKVFVHQKDTFVANLSINAKMNMKMDMGNYSYKLKNSTDRYELDFILPKCIWGDKRWYVKFEFFEDKKLCEKILLFDMDR
jgi:hypothetical protein